MKSAARRRRRLTVLTFAAFAVPTGHALAQDGAPGVLQFLPGGLLYESYRAGEKEARLGGALLRRDDGTSLFDAVLGGRFALLRFGTVGPAAAEGWQLDVEGAAMPRLNLDKIKDSFESADFRFGFPLTFRKGVFAAKAGYYHISSHVGDEYLRRNSGFRRINYVRDSFLYGVSVDVQSGLRTYAEVGYAFYTSGGAEPWELQFGSEYSRTSAGCSCGGPFLALNAHLREELDFGGSVNVVAGWEWLRDTGAERLRLGIRYFSGDSPQFEFLGRHERLFGLSLSLDL